jgi:hypothetical protein
MFFVRLDAASTTPKMFLSFGDKQERKGGKQGADAPECLTHHLVWKTHDVAIAKTMLFLKISQVCLTVLYKTEILVP